MLEAYLTVLVGMAAGQIAPGPNLVATASMALSRGRAPALMVVLSVATAILFWSMLTALGLTTLIELYPVSLTVMRLLGGSYLLYIALRSARAAMAVSATSPAAGFATNDEPGITLSQAWRRGLLVNLTNPKSALLWTAVATYLYGAGLTPWQVILFGPVGVVSACVIYGTYAFLFSTGAAMRGYQKFSRWFEAIFAGAFGVMGAVLVGSGIRDLRS